MFEPITTSVIQAQTSTNRPILASGCFGALALPAKKARSLEMTHERFQALMTNYRPWAVAFNWPRAA